MYIRISSQSVTEVALIAGAKNSHTNAHDAEKLTIWPKDFNSTLYSLKSKLVNPRMNIPAQKSFK